MDHFSTVLSMTCRRATQPVIQRNSKSRIGKQLRNDQAAIRSIETSQGSEEAIGGLPQVTVGRKNLGSLEPFRFRN